jgi:predicted ribosome quality control (RQC) complex YloA/Tae2 family protein
MYLDALTVLALRDELRATVLGGRVQHVHLSSELAVAIEVFAQGTRRWLYCAADPQRPRAYLTGERPPRTSDVVTPLLLLLRKYVDGARLDYVEQPELERILRLGFANRLPDGTLVRTELVVELLGRQSNLVLVHEDGAILDVARRVTPEMSRTRTLLPHWRYTPPPPQERLDPRILDGRALHLAAGEAPADRTVAGFLVSAVGACSPLLAREVVYRAFGPTPPALPDVSLAGWDQLAAEMRLMWHQAESGEAVPSLAYEGERVVAYAPYLLRSFPDVRPAPSISRALEVWYGQPAGTGVADAARRRALAQALAAAQDRLRAKRYSLQRSLVDPVEIDRLRRSGEYLLAFGPQIAPGAEAWSVPGEDLTIALDPHLTAVQNAQQYFARYAKTKAAAQQVPAMLAAVEHDLRYLDEALILLELARSPSELAALQAEWAELGFAKPPKGARIRHQHGKQRAGGTGRSRGRPQPSRPAGQYAQLEVGGFPVLLGRSGRGNDALLGPESHPDDLWLHARGVAGAHVLVRSRGRPVPEPVLRRAAALAAAHSQARSAGSVAVDYTARKHVQRIRGAPPGLVTYRGERTIYVAPETLL